MPEHQYDWRHADPHPDPQTDLGYDRLALDLVRDEQGRYIVMPAEQERCQLDEYLLINQNAVCTLTEHR